MSYRQMIFDARHLIVAPALILFLITGCSEVNPCSGKVERFMELADGEYVLGCEKEVNGDFIRFNVKKSVGTKNIWITTAWQRRTEKVESLEN